MLDEAADIEDTIIDVKKNRTIAKEQSMMYIDNLIPNTDYHFNLSARFIDGLWGRPFPLHFETSAEGAFSYQQLHSILLFCSKLLSLLSVN